MKAFIKLNDILIDRNKIVYSYSVSSELTVYFNLDKEFTIEYNLKNLKTTKDFLNIPKSILCLPFLGNVLPISWLFDATVIVEEIDKYFFDSIEEIKKGFINMYPTLSFKGNIEANKIIDNSTCDHSEKSNILFFSAGVDAWQTLIEHIDENPVMLTMFGADFYLDNKDGIEYCTKYMQNLSNDLCCELVLFKSSLRQFINEKELNKVFEKELGFHWWHRIQHGLGVILHAAPIAWLKNSEKIWFASSYSFKDRIKHKCATDPTIDNNISFVRANVVHDGYEYSRQDKIYNILRYSRINENNLFIHVCWSQGKEIQNCCRCEKCLRTIFGILAEGYYPKDYGFNVSVETASNRVKYLLEKNDLVLTDEMWEQIFFRFYMNPGLVERFPELKWVWSFDFSNRRQNRKGPQKGIKYKIKSILRGCLK